MNPLAFHLGKAGKIAASITSIVVLLGIILTGAKVLADNRYVSQEYFVSFMSVENLKNWQEEVDLIKLKQSAGVFLPDDDIKLSFYQSKIDRFNLIRKSNTIN